MRRTVMMVIVCAVLATPLMASADDQTIPPEAHWTPTPLTRSTVDVDQLARVLVDKGVITPREYSQLNQSQASSPSQHSRARVWSWDEADYPAVPSTGGD
jgi:hypothetical protein